VRKLNLIRRVFLIERRLALPFIGPTIGDGIGVNVKFISYVTLSAKIIPNFGGATCGASAWVLLPGLWAQGRAHILPSGRGFLGEILFYGLGSFGHIIAPKWVFTLFSAVNHGFSGNH
jgi:hypothetical protein